MNVGQRRKNITCVFWYEIGLKEYWRSANEGGDVPGISVKASFRFYTLSTSGRTVNEGGETWPREVTPLTFETLIDVVEMEPANNLLFTHGKVKPISTKYDWVWFCKDNVHTVRRSGCFVLSNLPFQGSPLPKIEFPGDLQQGRIYVWTNIRIGSHLLADPSSQWGSCLWTLMLTYRRQRVGSRLAVTTRARQNSLSPSLCSAASGPRQLIPVPFLAQGTLWSAQIDIQW